MTMFQSFRKRLALHCFVAFVAAMASTVHSAPASDEAWLARVGFSAQPAALQALKEQGRTAYLQQQLSPPASDDLPRPVQAYIERLSSVQVPAADALLDARAQSSAIADADGETRAKLRTKFAKTKQQNIREASEVSVLRATFSPWQLREQLTWFWVNHFNVFHSKANIPFVLADYENTLRKHALGNFRDLVEASLKHPAMIMYLDNAQSTKEKPNENYARELMELHTLGVNGGYSQADVQALAKILTGVSVDYREGDPKLPAKLAPLYISENGFQFDPRRHDFSDKKFLGHTIKGSGWPEVEQVLDILVANPATAQHIAQQLATFLVADEPSKGLVKGAAEVFSKTKGDIKATVQFLVESADFEENAGKQFKSPYQYAISAVQIANIDDPKRVVRVVRQSLAMAGQPLYGRLTPDGYELKGSSWISTGQLANRLAIAENVAGLRGKPVPRKKQQNERADGAMRNASMSMQAPRRDAAGPAQAGPAQQELFLHIAGPGFMYR